MAKDRFRMIVLAYVIEVISDAAILSNIQLVTVRAFNAINNVRCCVIELVGNDKSWFGDRNTGTRSHTETEGKSEYQWLEQRKVPGPLSEGSVPKPKKQEDGHIS